MKHIGLFAAGVLPPAASALRPDEYAFYGVTGSGAALRAEPLDG